MSTNNTSEGNRIIAEFMGAKITNEPDPFWPDDVSKNRWYASYEPGNNPNPLLKSGTKRQLYDLRYHTSWDWLMPACKKFDTLDTSNLSDDGKEAYTLMCDLLDSCMIQYEIEPVYEQLVDCIKWYYTIYMMEINSQQNDPHSKV